MEKLLKKLPFIMALLTVLFCGYTLGVIGLNHAKNVINSAVNQESAPDVKIDMLARRMASSRVLFSASNPEQKDPLCWPILLTSIASLLALGHVLFGLPRTYSFIDSDRLAGWQGANLQYRFTHSRRTIHSHLTLCIHAKKYQYRQQKANETRNSHSLHLGILEKQCLKQSKTYWSPFGTKISMHC
ncbi:hypothetical protein [Enterovibrio norvegicus]|uniref:hypothetical protein n=1 Tax=Enterovibrio norvegicus TaxID=188144 RepID=UPI0009F3AE59|nr:hypothetical protein [Enterovibrio norvegicus]